MSFVAWSMVLAAVALGSCWVAGSGVWDVRFPGGSSRTSSIFAARNAIVLLSAGVDRWKQDAPFSATTDGMSRIEHAAAAYASCKANGRVCNVIISGGDPEGHGIADAELYAEQIVTLGVEQADVVLEARSNTTYENAKYVEPLLRSGRYDVVVLVTSAYHMRRAEIAFDRVGLHVIPDAAQAERAEFSVIPRRHNFYLARRALHEWGGIVQLRLFDWAGIP
ncbi:YdcF family protein [Caballeronia grimmiae]|uniref:YdcF family protein n=1 Tax=Caballeronia grimmiae TaxID=1071679 RepID=UPI0038BC2AAD